MASGETIDKLTPQQAQPTATDYATLALRNYHLVLQFDATTAESTVFNSVLGRNYGGGGITVYLQWAAASATSGNVKWNAQIERLAEAGDDLDADSFAAAQTVTATTNGTSGVLDYAAIVFTSGAQMDSLAVGESYRIKITRDAADAADTMTGDAELLAVEIKET